MKTVSHPLKAANICYVVAAIGTHNVRGSTDKKTCSARINHHHWARSDYYLLNKIK